MNASFLLVLGLLVTSALAEDVKSDEELSTVLNPHQKLDSDKNNVITNMTTASSSNHSDTNNSTITLPTEKADGDNETSAATTTEQPIVVVSKTTKSTTSKNDLKLITTAASLVSTGNDTTGIIIVSIIILAALGFGVGCYIARRRGRSNSVDFNSRPDESNIPLNAEVTPLPDVFVAEIAEPDKAVVDPGAESAEPPDIGDDNPKEEVVQEQSAAPPVTVAENENSASKESSAESLQETAINSHKADSSQ